MNSDPYEPVEPALATPAAQAEDIIAGLEALVADLKRDLDLVKRDRDGAYQRNRVLQDFSDKQRRAVSELRAKASIELARAVLYAEHVKEPDYDIE